MTVYRRLIVVEESKRRVKVATPRASGQQVARVNHTTAYDESGKGSEDDESAAL
jgi:hypothetical protein